MYEIDLPSHRRTMHKTKVAEKTFHYPIMKYTFHRSIRQNAVCIQCVFAWAITLQILLSPSHTHTHTSLTPRQFSRQYIFFHFHSPWLSLSYSLHLSVTATASKMSINYTVTNMILIWLCQLIAQCCLEFSMNAYNYRVDCYTDKYAPIFRACVCVCVSIEWVIKKMSFL